MLLIQKMVKILHGTCGFQNTSEKRAVSFLSFIEWETEVRRGKELLPRSVSEPSRSNY